MFLPIVHGREEYDSISKLDFSDPASLVAKECKECPIVKLCRTCYGYNYLDRGDVANRDKSKCKMHLVEAQVISAFQINYLMQKQEREKLTTDDLLMLKAAVVCYEKTRNLSIDIFE